MEQEYAKKNRIPAAMLFIKDMVLFITVSTIRTSTMKTIVVQLHSWCSQRMLTIRYPFSSGGVLVTESREVFVALTGNWANFSLQHKAVMPSLSRVEKRYNGRRYYTAVGESQSSINIPASQYNSIAAMPLFVRRRCALVYLFFESFGRWLIIAISSTAFQ